MKLWDLKKTKQKDKETMVPAETQSSLYRNEKETFGITWNQPDVFVPYIDVSHRVTHLSAVASLMLSWDRFFFFFFPRLHLWLLLTSFCMLIQPTHERSARQTAHPDEYTEK